MEDTTQHDYIAEFIAYIRQDGVTLRDAIAWLGLRGLEPTFSFPKSADGKSGTVYVNQIVAMTRDEYTGIQALTPRSGKGRMG